MTRHLPPSHEIALRDLDAGGQELTSCQIVDAAGGAVVTAVETMKASIYSAPGTGADQVPALCYFISS